MFHLEASGIDQLYPQLLDKVLGNGSTISPRGQETMEVIGASFTLEDSHYNVVPHRARRLNLSFMAAEFVWMLQGSSDARLITPFNKQLAQFSDDGLFFRGAYGPKLVEQLPYILETLTNDPSSRQAVLTIWRERPGPSKDIPCTVAMQFMIRQGQLHMLVYMRSNDLWLGLPYDVFNFTSIQQVLAAALGVEVGPYHHHVGSLHLYEQHVTKALEVIAEPVYGLPAVEAPAASWPMPTQFLTMAVGLAALGPERSPADIHRWLDAGAWNLEGFWGDLLELLAFRFHKAPDRLPAQYQTLLQYWDHPAEMPF